MHVQVGVEDVHLLLLLLVWGEELLGAGGRAVVQVVEGFFAYVLGESGWVGGWIDGISYRVGGWVGGWVDVPGGMTKEEVKLSWCAVAGAPWWMWKWVGGWVGWEWVGS